jgi:16S rRNA (guanine527-N7)-methyltransferase
VDIEPVSTSQWRLADWFPAVPAPRLESIRRYQAELLKFNPRINLISRATEREADEFHFADAVSAGLLIGNTHLTGEVHDFGSGNGIPGLVFALMYPSTQFVLVESDSRKIEFLKHVAFTLKLGNVTTAPVRVEDLPAGRVNIAVNRGFASVTRTLALAERAVAPAGRILHLKGSGVMDEVAEVTPKQGLSWATESLGEYRLPVSGAVRSVLMSTRA